MATSTTNQQDKEFAELVKNSLDFSLDANFVLEWIEKNFAPEDVFGRDVLDQWAENEGFTLE